MFLRLYFILFGAMLSTSIVVSQNIPNFNKHKETIKKTIGDIERKYKLGISLSPEHADSAIFYGDHLIKQGLEESNDSAKYFGKILIARGYYNKQQFDSAKIYLEYVLSELEDNEKLFNYYFSAKNLFGLVLWRMKEIEKAKIVFEEMLDEIELVEHAELKAGILNNLSNINKILGDYNSAIKYLEEAVKLNPENPFAVANSYLSIGTMYNMLGDFNEADKSFNNSLSVKGIPPEFLLSVYTSKANNFKKWDKRDSSEFYYMRGLKIARKIPDHPTKIRPYIELSEINIQKGKLDEAKKYAEEAKRISEKINDKLQQQISDYTLFKISLLEGKFKKAIKQGEELIQFAKENNLEHALRDTYQLISTAYDSLGEVEVAHTYLKIHTDYIERMKDYGKLRTQIDMRAKYNSSKMQKRITEAEDAQQVSSVILILSAIGIIVFVYLSYSGFKKYKREKEVTSTLIQEKNLQKEKISNLVEKQKEADASQAGEGGYIFVNNQKIEFTDIIYISSSGHYLYYHLHDRKSPILERRNLKDVLFSLPADQFVQIHRSYIVNIRHVKHFTLQDVALSNNKVVKISRTYKNNLVELIEKSN